MAQKIDIGDYVNLNLDQNDMATALNNLNNPNGSQIIENLMQQYDNVQQQPPMMQQQHPQQLMQPLQQPQLQQQQQQMQQQPIQQLPMQQPIISTLFNKQNDEKNKILKDLDLSEKKPVVDTTIVDTQSTKNSLMLHIKETILVVLLYLLIGTHPFSVKTLQDPAKQNLSPTVGIRIERIFTLQKRNPSEFRLS